MGKLIIENHIRYEFFDTSDGSPSICMSSEEWRPEAMHHRQGALSESLFIYHDMMAEALSKGVNPYFLSVGLGCAYNEMICVAHFLANGLSFENFYLESFEGDQNLREGFMRWLLPEGSSLAAQSAIADMGADSSNNNFELEYFFTLQKIASLLATHFKLESAEIIKSKLLELFKKKQFVLRDWLTAQTEFSHKFGCIFFDAFSNKSTPDLWTDNFLLQFLNKCADKKCGFATYAATGALNRSLKLANFELCEQKGFSGKRQSTRAFRI